MPTTTDNAEDIQCQLDITREAFAAHIVKHKEIRDALRDTVTALEAFREQFAGTMPRADAIIERAKQFIQ